MDALLALLKRNAILCAFAAGTATTYCVCTWLFQQRMASAYTRFRAYQQQEAGDSNAGHAIFMWERIPQSEALQRSELFYKFLNQRRTVRFFSTDPVDIRIVENCILTAGTSPSGAHLQPWKFVIVQDIATRRQIRDVVEAEEQENYDRRMSKAWVDDLDPIMSALHTSKDHIQKPYLTDAPYLVVVMKIPTSPKEDGGRQVNYYAEQSTGIACGLLIAALHNANLATLTSTPLNAEGKIRAILGRPDHEKVFLLLPVGYPAPAGTVPLRDEKTLRKPFEEICLEI